MPTIFEYRGYAFRIHTNDHPPAHVHIVGPEAWVVLELESRRIIRAGGLKQSQQNKLIAVATRERRRLLAAWGRIHEG